MHLEWGGGGGIKSIVFCALKREAALRMYMFVLSGGGGCLESLSYGVHVLYDPLS